MIFDQSESYESQVSYDLSDAIMRFMITSLDDDGNNRLSGFSINLEHNAHHK